MAKERASKGGASSTNLEKLSVVDLQREIMRRQRSVKALHRKRARLVASLQALDAQLRDSGGLAGRGARVRPHNAMSLVESLSKVLKGKTMGVSEAADAVQAAGYMTSSPSFRTIVNQALLSSGKFKRTSRGKYTAI